MKLVRVVSAGETDGAYEFDDGSVLFWTQGRGGFVVEGGLGFFPKVDDFRAKMQTAEQAFAESANFALIAVEGLYALPEDLMKKAKDAAQSEQEGKYKLANYLKETKYLDVDVAQLKVTKVEISDGLGDRLPAIETSGTYRGEPFHATMCPELFGRDMEVDWIVMPTSVDEMNMQDGTANLMDLEPLIYSDPAYLAVLKQAEEAYEAGADEDEESEEDEG